MKYTVRSARLQSLLITFAAVFTIATASPSRAHDESSDKEDKERKVSEPTPPSVTQHSVTLHGQQFDYTATTGQLQMKDDAGVVKAEIFSVAYTRDNSDVESRPVTFCFNGGPGSASVWLHLGMLGPARVRLPDDATTPAPPYRTEPNPHSLLDMTDLVLIDPVSTGYSRAAEGEDRKQFHGYEEDLRSVGQFIHDYTTKNGRWASPKFVLGESYGGVRAAGLSGTLQARYRMYLNGIIMISPVVDFSTIRFANNNELPYIMFLPSYAATAWHHHRLADQLQQMPLTKVVAKAEKFAYGKYSRALLLGTSLSTQEREQVAKRHALLTGLSPDFVLRNNLRVEMSRFAKELLRDEGKTVGRFDSRYTGIDRDNADDRYSYDPSSAAMSGIFAAGLNDYLRRALKYENERVYEISGSVRPWSYGSFENRYVDASD